MYGIRPTTQRIKVRGRDKAASIKQFKIAPGHIAVLRTGARLVKVNVRQLPTSGDGTYRGEVVAVKPSARSLPRKSTAVADSLPQVGASSDFTLQNVFCVEV